MWSDIETTEDLLGFKVYSDLVYETITDPRMLPITIGVFADWGGGKSSILRMIQKRLVEDDPQDGVHCLYVNTWLFEGYEDAKSALIGSILAQLEEHPTLGQLVKVKLGLLRQSANLMRLARLGFHSAALGASAHSGLVDPTLVAETVGDVAAVGAGLLPEPQPKPSVQVEAEEPVRLFRERFETMLRDANIKSLIVLVDDLDRCSPERIVENLEAIKLFLNVERTAFVLGADPRLVTHAILVHFRWLSHGIDVQTKDEKQIVKDYLEKIVQLPFALPRLSVPEVQSYMSMLFCRHVLDRDEDFAACQLALANHVAEDRYTPLPSEAIVDAVSKVPGYDEENTEQLQQLLGFCRMAAPLIGEGLKGNPRLIKRFLNTYLVRQKMAGVANISGIVPLVLVKLMVLEYGSIDDFQQLYESIRGGRGFSQELVEVEEAAEGEVGESGPAITDGGWKTSAFVRRWAKMPPALRTIDLRDYFWLSRDKVEASSEYMEMLAPRLRKVLESLLSPDSSLQEQTATALAAVAASDAGIVLAELGRSLAAAPATKEPYIAFVECIEAQVQGAEDVLAASLENTKPELMNAAAAYRLVALLGRVECGPRLKSVIDRLSETDSVIGMALKKAVAKKR